MNLLEQYDVSKKYWGSIGGKENFQKLKRYWTELSRKRVWYLENKVAPRHAPPPITTKREHAQRLMRCQTRFWIALLHLHVDNISLSAMLMFVYVYSSSRSGGVSDNAIPQALSPIKCSVRSVIVSFSSHSEPDCISNKRAMLQSKTNASYHQLLDCLASTESWCGYVKHREDLLSWCFER